MSVHIIGSMNVDSWVIQLVSSMFEDPQDILDLDPCDFNLPQLALAVIPAMGLGDRKRVDRLLEELALREEQLNDAIHGS